MAYCTNCGGELFETSKFCPHCGTPVLELSSRHEDEQPKKYDTEVISNDVEGLPEVNTGILTPEEQAAVLEMAAENILEDIPDIKKLDSEEVSKNKPENAPEEPKEPAAEVHKEEALKPEPQKPSEEKKAEDKSEPKPEPKPEIKSISKTEPISETVNVTAETKKKGKGGIIAVIAVLAVAAAGGAIFFLGQRSEPVNNAVQTDVITELTEMTVTEIVPESEAVSEVPETELPAEMATVTETELTSETAPSSETEISAEEAVSETVLSEVSEGEGMYSAEALAEGIIIEPEHQNAMGNAVSAEISLSAEGISTDILSSGVLFLAEYTSTASAPANLTPAAMVITINDTPIEVTATSCSEGMVIFEYDVMTAAVAAAGFTAADIDSVAIKSTGVPIDVFRITILHE